MLVKEVFKESFTGLNINNLTNNDKFIEDAYIIQKDSIQYSNIIEKRLIKRRISSNIKNKYLMQERDIIISLKKPYKVGTYRFNKIFKEQKKVIIPNNFIVLRGINMDLYSYIFVANYLEKIGIEKYVNANKLNERIYKELLLEDVLNIDLPEITKSDQMKISKLMNLINDRSAIYSTILENDDEIIKHSLKEVLGETNDK